MAFAIFLCSRYPWYILSLNISPLTSTLWAHDIFTFLFPINTPLYGIRGWYVKLLRKIMRWQEFNMLPLPGPLWCFYRVLITILKEKGGKWHLFLVTTVWWPNTYYTDATADLFSLIHTRLWVPRVGMIVYLTLYPQCLQQCLAHIVIKNVCCMNEWVIGDAHII